MSLTHRITREWSRGDATLSQSKDIEAGGEANVSEEFADGSTDVLFAWAVDVSQLKSLHIQCDQEVTIETNNPGGASAAADDVLTVKPNQPITWQTGDEMTCPLTADVTQAYLTNASGSAAQLDIRALVDITV